MIAGLFVPIAYANKIKKASFVKDVGMIHFEGTEEGSLSGNYRLVLTSRYLLGMDLETLAKHKPAFRLRSQVLVDVQAWFASHAARPGYISITP